MKQLSCHKRFLASGLDKGATRLYLWRGLPLLSIPWDLARYSTRFIAGTYAGGDRTEYAAAVGGWYNFGQNALRAEDLL